MQNTGKKRVQNGRKEYRKVGVNGGLNNAIELIEKCDPDDPRVYCALSALTMTIPIMEAANAAFLNDPNGMADEEFWSDYLAP